MFQQQRQRLRTAQQSVLYRLLSAMAIMTVLCSFSIGDGDDTTTTDLLLETNTSALCEPGWTLKGESCYKLTTELLTWSEAQMKCRSMMSLLVEVHNDDEQAALNEFLNSQESPVLRAWIGLSDQQRLRFWIWGSGRPMNYSKWFGSEPDNSGGAEHCVNVRPRELSSWYDYICNAKFPGVCQKGYCSIRWTSTRKACYQLTEAASRSAAHDKCRSMGGSLAEINNLYEQDELYDFLSSQEENATHAWIGLTDPRKNGVWAWDSGSEFTYSRWMAGEPNNQGGEEYCVNVWHQYNFDWNDDYCYYNYSGVCKQSEEFCEPGWTLKGESCYKLTTELLTWSEAQETCRSMKSLLAEVHNDGEQTALNEFLNAKVQSAWIGLSDHQMNRFWTWGSGRPMNYSKWFRAEPNNKGGAEHCVNVWPRDLSSWNDNACNAKFPGVCQKGCATASELCQLLSQRGLCSNGLFKHYMNVQCRRSCGRCS